jgi:hypothetical protein
MDAADSGNSRAPMIELLRIAFIVSVVGWIGPFGIGYLWAAALTWRGQWKPSAGMTYWLGLISLGAAVLFGQGLRLPQGSVDSLTVAASTGGWNLAPDAQASVDDGRPDRTLCLFCHLRLAGRILRARSGSNVGLISNLAGTCSPPRTNGRRYPDSATWASCFPNILIWELRPGGGLSGQLVGTS